MEVNPSRVLPKLKGFQSYGKVDYQVVNLDKLNNFDSGATITKQDLLERGFISSLQRPVKILGDGELKHPLTVSVEKISQAALNKLEKAGGSYEVLADNS